jgi:hypothetical protein
MTDKKIQKAVDQNLKKYKKTYQLLDEYDKSPETAPSYQAEFRKLQETIHKIPETD